MYIWNQIYIREDAYNTNFGSFLEESLVCKCPVTYLYWLLNVEKNSKEEQKRNK